MEQQLLAPIAAAAAAHSQAAESCGGVYASLNQQRVLRLAMQRQQQEERQQMQREKQQGQNKASQKQDGKRLEQRQQHTLHRESQQQLSEKHQEGLQLFGKHELLKCVHLSTTGAAMHQNSLRVAPGSGSVSTANSGSESSSRCASSDEAENSCQGLEMEKGAARGYAQKGIEIDYKGDVTVPHQHNLQSSEHPYEKHQWQPGQHHQRPRESGQHPQQQQRRQQQEKASHHGALASMQQGDPLGFHESSHKIQQRLQPKQSAEPAVEEERVEPREENNVRAASAGAHELHTRAFDASALPLHHRNCPPLSTSRALHCAATHVAPADYGVYHLLLGQGCPNGVVRQARKKVLPPTPPSSLTSSVTSFATPSSAKVAGTRSVGHMYRHSRVTEVKSFVGTLEEYLAFREQQAAVAHNNNSGSSRPAETGFQQKGRKTSASLCRGSRRTAAVRHSSTREEGQKEAVHSCRMLVSSATPCPRSTNNFTEEELHKGKGTEGDLQSKCKAHSEQLSAWRSNVLAQQQQQQQRRTLSQKSEQLTLRQINDCSQRECRRVSKAISSSPTDCRGSSAASHPSCAVNETNLKTERERTGAALSSAWSWGRDFLRTNAKEGEPSRKLYDEERIVTDASSANIQQRQATDGSDKAPDGEEAEGEEAALTKGYAKIHEHNADRKCLKRNAAKIIPLQMQNGEIVWPTDRPIIPLNAWTFQNFSEEEPLNPQNWVHLPNVGPAASPPMSSLAATQQQNRHPPSRPPICCRTVSLVYSPLFPGRTPTKPVKTPPIKLGVGCEVPHFVIQMNTEQGMATRANMQLHTSEPAKTVQRRGYAGRPAGSSPPKQKFAYTPFVKQVHVRHRLTNFEGLVVRMEREGHVLLVRSKEGHVRKLPREECEATKFTCAATSPPERLLTDAAHLHSAHLLSTTTGPLHTSEASCASGRPRTAISGSSPEYKSSVSPRNSISPTTMPSTCIQQRIPSPQPGAEAKADCEAAPQRRSRSLLDLFRTCSNFSPAFSSLLPRRKEQSRSRGGKQQTQQLKPQQLVPDIQEVLTLAEQHASDTMRSTVALKNMATIPSIRAVESQVAVEAICVKKYTLEGERGENLLPVFNERGSDARFKYLPAPDAASAGALREGRPAPLDAARLLLRMHEARQQLNKREEELSGDEVIYAKDAPDVTRASGIVPPTIVKESLVVPPEEDCDPSYIAQAPGIVLGLSQRLNTIEKPKAAGTMAQAWPQGSDTASVSTESPNQQPPYNDDYREMVAEGGEIGNGSVALQDATGPAWFSDLKAQFRHQLLQQYIKTGSMEAAALAVSSGALPDIPAIQRKQATVLRDELNEMQFIPVWQNNPV